MISSYRLHSYQNSTLLFRKYFVHLIFDWSNSSNNDYSSSILYIFRSRENCKKEMNIFQIKTIERRVCIFRRQKSDIFQNNRASRTIDLNQHDRYASRFYASLKVIKGKKKKRKSVVINDVVCLVFFFFLSFLSTKINIFYNNPTSSAIDLT